MRDCPFGSHLNSSCISCATHNIHAKLYELFSKYIANAGRCSGDESNFPLPSLHSRLCACAIDCHVINNCRERSSLNLVMYRLTHWYLITGFPPTCQGASTLTTFVWNSTPLRSDSLYSYVQCSLVPRPHPQKEERVWYTSSAFWGAQDAAGHVIVMTTHRMPMATHQRLSRAAIGG